MKLTPDLQKYKKYALNTARDTVFYVGKKTSRMAARFLDDLAVELEEVAKEERRKGKDLTARRLETAADVCLYSSDIATESYRFLHTLLENNVRRYNK